jgi:hypothetical protein
MGVYDAIDLDWTWDGDYLVGQDGDIGDTSDDYIRSLENEIHNICKSETGDWQKFPMLGANLSEFQGEPNTRDNGRRLEDRISFRIVDAKLVDAGDLEVRVVPVAASQVLILIRILAAPTQNNRLTSREPIITKLLFDSNENSIFVVPPNLQELSAR